MGNKIKKEHEKNFVWKVKSQTLKVSKDLFINHILSLEVQIHSDYFQVLLKQRKIHNGNSMVDQLTFWNFAHGLIG